MKKPTSLHNTSLRQQFDALQQRFDALVQLESLVAPTSAVPISEADVGKTVGVTGIHNGETTQTLRDGAESPGEICLLCGGRSCDCPPVCPACRGRHSGHCMKNTMGWPCICGDVDCKKKQGSALEADELHKECTTTSAAVAADCAHFEATEAYIAATEAYMASRVHGSDDPEHEAWRRARSALSKLTERKLR